MLFRKIQSASRLANPEIAFTDNGVANLSGSNEYTASGFSIGTASPDRLVVVALCYTSSGAGSSINSVTIGGETGTVNVEASDAFGGEYCSIASASVASGTTADIVIDASGVVGSIGVSVWSLTGLSSTTPDDTVSQVEDETDYSLTTKDGGVGIGAIFYTGSGTGDGSFDFGTEEHISLLASSYYYGGATCNFTSSSTTVGASADFSDASYAYASWS